MFEGILRGGVPVAGTAGGGWSITWRAWGIFGEEYVLFVTDV